MLNKRQAKSKADSKLSLLIFKDGPKEIDFGQEEKPTRTFKCNDCGYTVNNLHMAGGYECVRASQWGKTAFTKEAFSGVEIFQDGITVG